MTARSNVGRSVSGNGTVSESGIREGGCVIEYKWSISRDVVTELWRGIRWSTGTRVGGFWRG